MSWPIINVRNFKSSDHIIKEKVRRQKNPDEAGKRPKILKDAKLLREIRIEYRIVG